MSIGALALAFALSVCTCATAVELPGLDVTRDIAGNLAAAGDLPRPTNVKAIDKPGDDGTALLLLFDITVPAGQLVYVMPQIKARGASDWHNAADTKLAVDELGTEGGMPDVFGMWPPSKDTRVITIEQGLPTSDIPASTPAVGGSDEAAAAAAPLEAAAAEGAAAAAAAAPAEPTPVADRQTYDVRLVVLGASDQQLQVDAGSATVRQNLYKATLGNVLLISIIFTGILLLMTWRARANPGRLFIRRIAGLEAVEEAIGRATEMGKPVMQINGLDPLTTPSTIAAVNILGQIARKVAHYDSRLMVPSFDPVVMTVSQETVKQAYMEEGRPDAYREEDIFFVTDQQFSYVASVCGLMLREKPAANFFLGYFYAESLLLAETGQSTGAIQIAGTDSQSQLPFFITTCDYTLIGEEIYAASAYLSREPILLGGLKGIDVSKVIIMLLILFGSVLATFGVDWLTKVFTPLG